MNNEQHSVPECEAKYDKEDMILEQLKIITNVQDTTKRLYSIIESGIISRCASQFDGNVETMRLNNENYAVEKICIPAGTLKTKDALISKYENLKSQEFYDSTTSKMQVSAINGSETVSNSKSVAEQKIIKRDEKESDSKLQLWANFPTGASSFQRQKQAEKNTEVCSEQQAKSCLSSTISKEYKNQEVEDKKSYEEIGTGALKLLFNKRTGTYIIFMSEEKSQKIVLNHGVTSQLNMRPSSLMNNAFMWQCRNTTD
ncbi:putative Ran-specific GTPase-activating protein [Trichinella spiralis]|uniref:putative Ran-specific GTPase-activating protein n=1 Tax=Trichinella spiralis TaxID=6334 RepID=UPI0001EFE10A|nr:putative Ran-specific GTPase-activating protein [Trichinella spiralis]